MMIHLLFKTDQSAKFVKVEQMMFEPFPRRCGVAQPDECILDGLRLSENARDGMRNHLVSPVLKRPLGDQRSFSALHQVDEKWSPWKSAGNFLEFFTCSWRFDEQGVRAC